MKISLVAVLLTCAALSASAMDHDREELRLNRLSPRVERDRMVPDETGSLDLVVDPSLSTERPELADVETQDPVIETLRAPSPPTSKARAAAAPNFLQRARRRIGSLLSLASFAAVKPGKIAFDRADAGSDDELAPTAARSGERALSAGAPPPGPEPAPANEIPKPQGSRDPHPIKSAVSLMPKFMLAVVFLGWLLEGVAKAAGDEGSAGQAMNAVYYALPVVVLSLGWAVSQVEARRLLPFTRSELSSLRQDFGWLKSAHENETRVKRLLGQTGPLLTGVLADLHRALPETERAAMEPRIETLHRILENAAGGGLAGWTRQEVALALIAAADRPLSSYVAMHRADPRIKEIRRLLKSAAVPEPELGPS